MLFLFYILMFSNVWLKDLKGTKTTGSKHRGPFFWCNVLCTAPRPESSLCSSHLPWWVGEKHPGSLQAAEWGKCCVEMTVQPSVYMDDEAVEQLEKRLGEFGFSSYATRHSKAGNVVISAAWMLGTETIQKADDGPQGIKANCPVCHENGYVVALMPCGHTVCKQCHPGLCQCPMCRKSLTGATQALFMGWAAIQRSLWHRRLQGKLGRCPWYLTMFVLRPGDCLDLPGSSF